MKTARETDKQNNSTEVGRKIILVVTWSVGVVSSRERVRCAEEKDGDDKWEEEEYMTR